MLPHRTTVPPDNNKTAAHRQAGGHALLVGVGGSGKRSLARLAAHVAGYRLFRVEPGRGYRRAEFRADLQRLYHQACGVLLVDACICIDMRVRGGRG